MGRRTSAKEETTMWLSFFTIATVASIGLGLAAFMLQNATQEELPPN